MTDRKMIVGDLQTGEVYEEPLPPPVSVREFLAHKPRYTASADALARLAADAREAAAES